MKKILFLCTGNSCRSQMAEGFANKLGFMAFSAGTNPESEVNPNAIKVMSEIEIDISNYQPNSVHKYINEDFDFVITVCDNAKESCPNFSRNCGKNVHNSFRDPAKAIGTDKQVLNQFRIVRDEIIMWLNKFSPNHL